MMRLEAIRVRDFRKLAAPVELAGLDPGLCVVAGDNEAGKSTLLDALRAALFERHNVGGATLDAMMPFGSVVSPHVELDFTLAGRPFRLAKTFGKGAAARLETPEGTFAGPDADARLAALFGFEEIRGRAGEDQRRAARGHMGLLWMEQARVHHGLEIGETARRTLRGALEAEVGDVLGGDGASEILEAARARRAAYLTRTGRPTGALADATAEAERRRAEADAAAAELAEWEAEADALARDRADRAAFDAERRLETLAERLAAAEAALAEAERAETAAKAAAEARARAAREADAARRARADRAALARAAAEADAALPALRADAEAAATARNDTRTRVAEARARRETARTRLRETRAAATRADAARRAAEARRRAEALTGALTRARDHDARIAEARRAAAALRLDPRALPGLREAARSLREAEIARDAAATQVEVAPDPGAGPARIAGAPLPQNTPHALDRDTEITLEGWGRLTVRPGAGDLAERRDAVAAAGAALADALAAQGCDSLAAAERAAEALARHDAARREAEAALAAVAPEGLAALARAAEDAAAEAARFAEAAGSQAPDTADPAAVEAAEAEGEAAEAALETAAAREAAAGEAAIRATTTLETAETAARDAARRLAEARAETPDDALAAAETAAAEALTEAETAATRAEAARAEAEPETARLTRDRFARALGSQRDERSALDVRIAGREGRLQGRTGLGERAELAASEAEAAEARAAALCAEAEALDLLVATLAAAEAEARAAVLAPVVARARPYLRLLQPEAELALSQDLDIAGLTRAGREEPFERLSVGAREQVSVLVRLAFADWLAETGRPAMVVLDDALNHADAARLERMQTALWKAAERLQVLVLTCRPRDWTAAGATVRRLAQPHVAG